MGEWKRTTFSKIHSWINNSHPYVNYAKIIVL